MASSQSRNRDMIRHLDSVGLPYNRVEAVDVSGVGDYNLSKAHFPCSEKADPLLIEGSILGSEFVRVDNLCVISRNFLKEVAVCLSHIKALLAALESNNTNPYALVLEDDMSIMFDVDFDAFAKIFPSDFGIVQLFVMNPVQQTRLLRYSKRKKYVIPWEPLFWSTGGYLMNKATLRLHLGHLLQQRGNRVFGIDLIAGANRIIILGQDKTRRRKVCWPAQCCVGIEFQPKFPCVLSPHGVAADYYIYSIAHGKTYVSTFPILAGTTEAYVSTISLNHTSDDTMRIKHGRKFIRDIYSGLVALPPYLRLRYSDSEAVEVFYVNYDTESAKPPIESHLESRGYRFTRVDAVQPVRGETYDLAASRPPCARAVPLRFRSDAGTITVDRLCAGNSSTVSEVAATLSHLKAIVAALRSPNINNFALILESGARLSFRLDFKALIESLPRKCAIMQLHVDDPIGSARLRALRVSKQQLYTRWYPQLSGVRGYLINKHALATSLNATGILAQPADNLTIALIAGGFGAQRYCFPSECCNGLEWFKNKFPCVQSRSEIAPSQFLYNIVARSTFTSTVPLVHRSGGEDEDALHALYSRPLDLPKYALLFDNISLHPP